MQIKCNITFVVRLIIPDMPKKTLTGNLFLWKIYAYHFIHMVLSSTARWKWRMQTKFRVTWQKMCVVAQIQVVGQLTHWLILPHSPLCNCTRPLNVFPFSQQVRWELNSPKQNPGKYWVGQTTLFWILTEERLWLTPTLCSIFVTYQNSKVVGRNRWVNPPVSSSSSSRI